MNRYDLIVKGLLAALPVLIVAGIGLCIAAFRTMALRRLIRRIAALSIAGVAFGLVCSAVSDQIHPGCPEMCDIFNWFGVTTGYGVGFFLAGATSLAVVTSLSLRLVGRVRRQSAAIAHDEQATGLTRIHTLLSAHCQTHLSIALMMMIFGIVGANDRFAYHPEDFVHLVILGGVLAGWFLVLSRMLSSSRLQHSVTVLLLVTAPLGASMNIWLLPRDLHSRHGIEEGLTSAAVIYLTPLLLAWIALSVISLWLKMRQTNDGQAAMRPQ